MCRMEGDRIYPCDKARSGRPCRDVRRVPTSYIHQRGSSRDDTPSPVNPPTPTSSGTYLTTRRRPSNSGSRPSTRDGPRINPEIIIEFGSKKGKSSKYPSVSVSAKTHKRHSSGSFGSNDAAVDSGESEASYTIRTGFPEAPLPPSAFDQPSTFLSTPSHGLYPRHTPSASSSQTPSLLVPSETDLNPSAARRSTRPSATVIHHATTEPASPTRPQPGLSTGSYKTKRVVPSDLPQITQTPTSSHPLDYDQYADHSGSSRASSGIAEASRPAKNTSQRRKKSSEDNFFKDVSRRLAEDVEKSENERHVRFELDRYEARERERAERKLAEKEKDRAAIREEERERKRLERLEQEKKEREERKRLERLEQEERERKRLERLEQEERERKRLDRLEQEKKEREEQRARDRKKEKSKPPTTDNTKRPSSSRRMSSMMTPQEQAEQQRLLEADALFMQGEKQAAEAREREERRAAARQQQESSAYYDPRGGDRSLSSANPSKPRRDSAASITRPSGLVNASSRRRPSISQPSPPTSSAQLPTDYSTRPQTTRVRAPPPLSFPKNFNQDYGRPPSARRPSLTPDNPFLSASVASPTADPWDLRNMDSALPSTRTSDGRKHHTTQPVPRTPHYVSAFDDEDIGFDDFPPSFASRTGLSRSGSKKKH
ncbi:uncharacterized protein yc1106_01982 [Curvularia clavata]|uniref:Uncharacterized protein n=1 Tax=Curvularia clavata TaxID=95742 RepID=A0A9Q9DP33_CURCL|nr:uncharacterized protein yc1106_01982 [Curvularia clavata]